MKYLGSIAGTGVLLSDGIAYADATYELEGFMRKKGQMTGSGEIGLKSVFVKGAIARKDLQLRIADGQLLDLAIADTKTCAPDRIVVDISGSLPVKGDWRH